MGYDNTGILFYGILLDDQELPWDDYDSPYEGDWEKYWLEKTGFFVENPKPTNEPDWRDSGASTKWRREVYESWVTKRDEALESLDCLVGIYNSNRDPWSYVALKTAHREGGCCPPLELDPATVLLLPPDADEIIRRFCDYMGIPFQQPRWWLTGLYS